MPLSDNEQRLLEQMERALYAEDPKFASTMRGNKRRSTALSKLALGVVGIAAGLGLLVYGVAGNQLIVGVLGFLLMLAGTVYAFSARRRTGPAGVVTASGTVRRPSGAAASRSSSFMQRLEERWERRRNEP